jgi:hypothetical protein
MEKKKSEFFLENVAEMSELAGVLASNAVFAGKKIIRYVNDLTIVDTTLKPPAESGENGSETNTKTG